MGLLLTLLVYGLKLFGFIEEAESVIQKREEQKKAAAITKAAGDAPRTSQELIDLQNKGEF